jgi:hypothetical protein
MTLRNGTQYTYIHAEIVNYYEYYLDKYVYIKGTRQHCTSWWMALQSGIQYTHTHAHAHAQIRNETKQWQLVDGATEVPLYVNIYQYDNSHD